MNYAQIAKKTITRVFTEDQIPVHMKDEVLRIKAEARKGQVKEQSKEQPKSPLSKEVTPRPEFLEPISPVVKSPAASSDKMIRDYQKKNMEEYLRWEIQQPNTWLKHIDFLENQRSKITQKGALSANDLQEMDEIDAKIEYCEDAIADLEDDYFEDSE